jgi:hypothetical protein
MAADVQGRHRRDRDSTIRCDIILNIMLAQPLYAASRRAYDVALLRLLSRFRGWGAAADTLSKHLQSLRAGSRAE